VTTIPPGAPVPPEAPARHDRAGTGHDGTGPAGTGPAARGGPAAAGRWAVAAVRATRPRQWPKNLLVLAAPLAGASLGRADGALYALVALVAFIAASSAVYLVNDVADADRDRRHPVKRTRPVASGALPVPHALILAGLAIIVAVGAGVLIREPGLTATVVIYLAISFAYSTALKHVPVAELLCVASGFVLRALGGAAATHVPPSDWFLTVCSLGALMVAVAKRRGELAALGADAARHRPVMRWYRYGALDLAARLITAAIIVSYALWAVTSSGGSRELWHLASLVPLAVALTRFERLSSRAAGRPVEDLIIRDRVMGAAELAWLLLFALGL
jgi:decaprenyl-phosphate phosphoribosyltransferase